MGDGSGAGSSGQNPGSSSRREPPDQSGPRDAPPEDESQGGNEQSHEGDGDVDLGQMDSLDTPVGEEPSDDDHHNELPAVQG
eukprot:2501113-Karenia_brevis.AAC.1